MSIDIAGLRRLAEAATPGEWRSISDRNNRPIVICGGTIPVADCWHMPNLSGDGRANAQLIAAMRNALPSLLDELEALRNAARRTIDENLHLADGEVCTLIHLKRALKVDDAGAAEGKGDE